MNDRPLAERGRGLELLTRIVAVLALVTSLVWLFPLHAQPGPLRTYTCLWNHDGLNTDSYVVLVDGQPALTISNDAFRCPVAGPPRECRAELPMTTGVVHTVIVKAVNVFGEAPSDPFVTNPPTNRPVGVIIR